MKKYKYLAIFFQLIWIFLFALIGTLTAHFTGNSSLGYISLIAIYPIILLTWWVMSMNTNKKMDALSKVGNLIILNIPAYFLIKKATSVANEKYRAELAESNKYKLEAEKEFDQSVFIPEWEKERIAIKQAKKKAKPVNKVTYESKIDIETVVSRKIIRNFIKFVMYEVFVENEGITNTFKITELIKEKISDQKTRKKLISEYNANLNKWNKFDKKEANIKIDVVNLLSSISPEELMIAHKQDRVDITIEVQILLGL
ncbi:hypothetical protein [Mesoplasma photuris]|uniref:hypothetical protein n=1 Tax=Mesoplasma photuris TaxID=217731 RepID=UPI0004E258D1|nr:hypothetical protein [Mesoplasma photuris]